MPARVNGVHHLAISTADMKGQIEFFSDVLGAELVGLFWMHGVPGGLHGFLRLNDKSYMSFVELPANHDVPAELGVTHAGSGAGPSAPGTQQHLAFNVDSLEDLLAMRDRIRSRGINVMGYIEHGMCQSIYFAGPEGMTLEVTFAEDPIDARAWIDPEVVAIAGISEAELARYKSPDPYVGEGGAVPQPEINPAMPHMNYPPEIYAALMGTPDEEFAKRTDFADPPVKIPADS